MWPSQARFELLSDDMKDVVLENAFRSDDCKNTGKWCSLMRCGETRWERACAARGWNIKPPHFTWRIWYARTCNPDWAQQMDDALMLSSRDDDLDRVVDLLDRGANAAYDYALRVASMYGRLRVVRLLLDRGANAADAVTLRAATFSGHLEVVRLLLDRGANIHAADDEALESANNNGHLDVWRLLLTAQLIDNDNHE